MMSAFVCLFGFLLIIRGTFSFIDLENVDHRNTRWDIPAGRLFQVETPEEINNLQDELEPGDALVMKEGVWESPNIRLTASGRGEEGYKIYLIASVFGRVVLRGRVRIEFAGEYQEVRGLSVDGVSSSKTTPFWFEAESSHCRLTQTVITNFNKDDYSSKHHWIEIFGSYHTIDHNAFEGKQDAPGQIVRVKTTNGDFKPPGAQPDSWGHTISWNYFGQRDDIDDDAEGIQIGLYESEFVDTETVVEHNLFEEYDGEIEAISVKASNNTLRYNTFRQSVGTLTLRHGDRNVVKENYFLCEGKEQCAGIRLSGEDHKIIKNYVSQNVFSSGSRSAIVMRSADEASYRQVKNALIERNVMYQCSRHCIAIGYQNNLVGPEGTTYKENVMQGTDITRDYCLREYEPHQTDPEYQDNTCWMGQVVLSEEAGDGIDEDTDPNFQFDETLGIYTPRNIGWDFSMKFKPLSRDDVGPTWY